MSDSDRLQYSSPSERAGRAGEGALRLAHTQLSSVIEKLSLLEEGQGFFQLKVFGINCTASYQGTVGHVFLDAVSTCE